MRKLRQISAISALALGQILMAAEPQLEVRPVFDIYATCGNALTLGRLPIGKRVMIPIVGGHTEGEVNAMVLPGGADYQIVDTVSGRVSYEAVYTLCTSDSCLINVRNIGVSNDGYFVTSPTFEAPLDSKYGWLNNRVFVCKPVGFSSSTAHFRVWVVD